MINLVIETGINIGRTTFFSIRGEDNWTDYGIAIDAEVIDNFSFHEIIVEEKKIFFPESRRIQEFIRHRIG